MCVKDLRAGPGLPQTSVALSFNYFLLPWGTRAGSQGEVSGPQRPYLVRIQSGRIPVSGSQLGLNSCDWPCRGLRQQAPEVKRQLLDGLALPIHHNPALRTPEPALVVTPAPKTFLQVSGNSAPPMRSETPPFPLSMSPGRSPTLDSDGRPAAAEI